MATTSDLLRSHDELRAALILAGKRIRKLNFGKRDDPVLPILRKVLREFREVAQEFATTRKAWRETPDGGDSISFGC
jgi:hypothetical protein